MIWNLRWYHTVLPTYVGNHCSTDIPVAKHTYVLDVTAGEIDIELVTMAIVASLVDIIGVVGLTVVASLVDTIEVVGVTIVASLVDTIEVVGVTVVASLIDIIGKSWMRVALWLNIIEEIGITVVASVIVGSK